MTDFRRPDLVIFDCDGVLVDSEPISLDVMLDVLQDAGVAISHETGYRQMLGKSLSTNIAWVEETYHLSVTETHLGNMRDRLFERFRTELRPVVGVAKAIEQLGMDVCVASSSQPDRIALSLELTGLSPLFGENCFSATMVAKGKPAPDLFLYAAKTMGVAPERCVVIEDSPAGIRAAKAAGMKVVAFVGASHAAPARLAETVEKLVPDAMIADMADLPILLRETA